jgi:hypothetical protein
VRLVAGALTVTVWLLAAGLLLAAGPALAKRVAPAEVPPIVIGGVRYTAPQFLNPCGQPGGCLVASDVTTGAQLWSLKVYCTKYDPNLETDVQDVFITSLAAQEGALVVANEKGQRFSIDVNTRGVSGDQRGCGDAAGCHYAPLAARFPLWLAGWLAIVLWRRRRAA